MRHDSGRLLEIQIYLVLLVVITAVCGSVWKPWGYLVGPAILVVIVLFSLVGGAIALGRQKKGRARLRALGDRQGPVPASPEIPGLIESASPGAEDRALCFKVLAEKDHPAIEVFAYAAYHIQLMSYEKDGETCFRLAEFIRDHPDAGTAPDLVRYIIDFADWNVALPTAEFALASGRAPLEKWAGRQSVYRATTDWKEGHEKFKDLVRANREKIDGLITDALDRKYLNQVLG